MFNGALPAGGVELAHLPLVLARALWLAALLSTTGALLFRAAAAPSEAARVPSVRAGLSRLIVRGLAAAAAAWVAWVLLQSAAIVGADGLAEALAGVGTVFARAAFGHRAVAQAVLLLAAWAALGLGDGRGRFVPAGLALAATAVQAGHSHAWAMQGGPGLLTGAVLLHLCAAAAWLGGLLPLALVVRHAPLAAATATLRRFSRVATALVLLLAATALVQAVALLGGLGGLFGTSYGWVALLKALLFAVLLGIAWRNRMRLMPALAARGGRAALLRSIALETAIGLLVLGAAALLSTLPPGMHTPPVWPFAYRPRLPLRLSGIADVTALALALALLGWAAVGRRWRLPALALAALLAGGAVPRLGGLLVPATPTSFFRSETGFTAAAIMDGARLFAARCAACHGAAPLLPARLAATEDGDLFWVLSSGTAGMPGFAATLDEDARWHLIDFLRARATAGALPVRAPDIDLVCADGAIQALSDARGHDLRLSLRAAPPPPGGCRAADPDAIPAYALASGLSPARLSVADLLIDAAGRLRAVVRPAPETSIATETPR